MHHLSMKKVEEKNMMHFVIEGNALKRKSKEKVKQFFIEDAGVRAPNQEEKVTVMKDLNTYSMHLSASIWKCFSTFVLMYNVFH